MPTAFSRFKETLDAPWINKMADEPLLVDYVPDTTVGIEARGALPVGPMKVIYSVYTINDPILAVNATDPTQNGTISYSNYAGFDDVPGFGGKLGFILLPELEVGGALLWSKVGQRGTGNAAFSSADTRQADVFAWNVYARFQKKTPIGTIDAQAEWVFQHIRKMTYTGSISSQGVDPTTGSPITVQTPFSNRYTNETQTGYFQLGFRPTTADNEYVKNLEFLVRYDWLGLPRRAPQGATTNTDTQRVAAGVDYWFTPSLVLKLEYEYTSVYAHTSLGAGTKLHDTESHSLIAQLAMGF
jgi:hypothetical protein